MISLPGVVRPKLLNFLTLLGVTQRSSLSVDNGHHGALGIFMSIAFMGYFRRFVSLAVHSSYRSGTPRGRAWPAVISAAASRLVIARHASPPAAKISRWICIPVGLSLASRH